MESQFTAPGLLRLIERVAGRDRAIVQAGAEPVHTLLGSAVREGFRAHVACGHFLQMIVADGGRRTQSGFNISFFKQAALLRGMRPHTRKAVRLKLQLHG